MSGARTRTATRHALCKLCEKVLRPHGDCMFCPECGELFARIDVPVTSPDGDNFGYVTTGTRVGHRRVPNRNRATLTQRKTARRVSKPKPVQGSFFDG